MLSEVLKTLDFFCSKRCTASSPVTCQANRTDLKLPEKQTRNQTNPRHKKRATPQLGLESLGREATKQKGQ